MAKVEAKTKEQAEAQQRDVKRYKRSGLMYGAASGACMAAFLAGATNGLLSVAEYVENSAAAEEKRQEMIRQGMVPLEEPSIYLSTQAQKEAEKAEIYNTLSNVGYGISTLASGVLALGFGSAASRRFRKAKMCEENIFYSPSAQRLIKYSSEDGSYNDRNISVEYNEPL